MISIKNDKEIEYMRKAGKLVTLTHAYLRSFIKEGIKTIELDKLAYDFILKNGGLPSCLGYEGYPNTLCISVNDTVVHGIPNNYKLKNGDIVTIDMVIGYNGYQADAAWSYAVGDISSSARHLMEHTEKALYEGIKQVKPGSRVGDISSAIEEYAKKNKLGIVKELCGHGIGTDMHEEPDIPNYGKKNSGVKLKKGMVICIEPMLTSGLADVYLESDEWTVKTQDGSLSAHFEHTVLVTEDGYDILTPQILS